MKENKTGLEDFVGHHRADFDTFEPRPDLWDAIARELDTEPAAAVPTESPLRIVPLHPVATPARRPRYAYGIAATLALLLLAGLGVLWTKTASHSAWLPTGAATVAVSPPTKPALRPENPFGLGAEPVATAAAEAPARRVASAVQRMESYYAIQLRERQAELNQLDAQLQQAAPADYQRELTALDSTYQQLKIELARNPEPDVVLDAMNRNLQIRLDILNQQLRTRAQVQEYSEAQPKP
ncbi:hypothetical protein SAMN02745146_1386 [Hymenobacter daecheongensis DSM 21074]|uniref:Anti-sigma factor n=1 Tax=Hymenobacter daecheongensis DSM 21074 TaxID=1121955 RepID=A0A1M6D638_9BACT|nr:hypothetical protein [Hymenobacter daecheongensis]SHI68603.1 hypothetical protein SAMN02745146_1386 [Hymenobacter daecheongensis DSM 21074]